MPSPQLRTRSVKRVKVKLPGGATKTHYKRRKTSRSLCAFCKKPLSGSPRLTSAEMRKLNYAKRRVWRPYGGQICPECLKTGLKRAIRVSA